MNYPAAELRGIKMILLLIHPDAEHRGILLIKKPLPIAGRGFLVCSKERQRRVLYRGCQKNVPIEDRFYATNPYAAILFSEHYYDKRYKIVKRFYRLMVTDCITTGSAGLSMGPV